MRVLFFGTSAFGVPSLERLICAGHQIVRCVTQPDRPQGRGLVRSPSPIKLAALKLGLALEEPDRLRERLPDFQRLDPDVGIVVSYGNLIPAELLRMPRLGIVGLHPSLLPKYRGASPIARAILDGETTTGVTIFLLNEQLDAGQILAQRVLGIEARATTATLSERLARLSADVLLDALDELGRGTAQLIAQDEARATYAPKFAKSDGRIDWRRSAITIDRLVRAACPWPGAFTQWRGQLVKIWAVRSEEDGSGVRPGEVLECSTEGLVISAGQGRVVVTELQLAGRRRMTAAEFAAGHRIVIGERLGVTVSDQ